MILYSCSIERRTTRSTIERKIKAEAENKKGNIVFENSKVKIYFNKHKALNILNKARNDIRTNKCDQQRIDNYISAIEKANSETRIFSELSSPSKTTTTFEIELQMKLIEKLILHTDFVIYDKKTEKYISEIFYRKKGSESGCCFAGFSFANESNFIDTRVFTDLLIIEECKE